MNMNKRNKWLTEEIILLKNNYEKLGVKKICELLPNHTKNSIIKMANKNNLKVNKSIYYHNIELINDIVKNSLSLSEVFRKLKKSKSGDSFNVLKNIIKNNNIDISHFDPYKNNRQLIEKKPINYWLKKDTNIGSSKLKEKLYNEGLKKRECEICGQDEMWNDKKMSLILDHINGVNNDNRLENLRIVCPNCNATLETHCRGSKGLCEKSHNPKKYVYKPNYEIRKIERPSYEILITEVNKNGYTKTGKKYGVSDNAIRKWIKYYEKNME